MIEKVTFTNNAENQINKITGDSKNKSFFRISVKGGGCSGFKYNFSIDNKINDNDVKFNNAVIDKDSLKLLNGSIVDFKSQMIGDSFVIENPKAKSSCGCGLSFSA
tara:strand:+ start:111 stop:428 length:318 start_codon:yes stop_codon:yes gene_type:complete